MWGSGAVGRVDSLRARQRHCSPRLARYAVAPPPRQFGSLGATSTDKGEAATETRWILDPGRHA